MSGCLYFVPGVTAPKLEPEQLRELGLAEVLRGAVQEFRQCHGPSDAGPGMLIATGGVACRVDVQAQSWARRLDGKAWTGVWTAQPPGPADLERTDAVGGYPVELHDGNCWLVPVARCFPEGTTLPETLVMGPGGLVRRVTAAYAGLWDDACRVWDAGGALPQEQLWRICVRALGVNYRLGIDEANLLELVTSANLPAMGAALIDAPAIAAASAELAAKKNAAAPAASSGCAASCPATVPPSPSSMPPSPPAGGVR